MSYEVKLHPQVEKFLQKCGYILAERIRAKLLLLAENPFQHLERFEGDYFKLRIGDYRALADVDTGRRNVWIRLLDHRKRIYQQPR